MSKIVGFLKDRVKTIHTVGCKSETVMRMFSYYLGQSVKILLNPRFCYVKYIWEVFTGNRHRTGLEFSTHRNHLGGGGLVQIQITGPTPQSFSPGTLGGLLESATPTSSQVLLMLLAQGPHFENH